MFQVDLQLIKESRKKKGYSIQDISDRMGFSDKSKYYRRETGEYNFRSEEIPLVAEILGIPIEKIFIKNVSKFETSKDDKE